jgi:hypothetical protein
MKKYKYVVVVGCSFSASDGDDLVNSGETYGDLISDYFDAKFYNLSFSGGSIQRMNRKTLEWCSKNKDKFEDTLIILGMTVFNRGEIWNNKTKSWIRGTIDLLPPGVFEDLSDERDIPNLSTDEFVIDWTLEERKKWFVNFYNDNAQITIANNILIGLQSFLTLNSIDHIFFDALAPPNKGWDNLISSENWYNHPEYKTMMDFTEKNRDMRMSEEDFHPNKKGHKYWADKLYEFIKHREDLI